MVYFAVDASPLSLANEELSHLIKFPEELKQYTGTSLHVNGSRVDWYRPTSLPSLLAIKRKHSDARCITGNTECGIETKLQGRMYPTLVNPSAVRELNQITHTNDGLVIGSGVTLTALLDKCNALIGKLPVRPCCS